MTNEEHILPAEKPERFFFRASAADFKKIPGSPIAYWVSLVQISLLKQQTLQEFAEFKEGLTTANNDLFLRLWSEVAFSKITIGASASNELLIWVPYNKGGSFRRWYGNHYFVVDWRVNGSRIKNYQGSSFRNSSFHFRRGGTFSALSSGLFSVRYSGSGFAFDSKGTMFFSEKLAALIIFLNSKICSRLLMLVAPTLDFRFGTIQKMPYLSSDGKNFNQLVSISKSDWDSYETSWDFTSLPLLNPDYRQSTLKSTYNNLRAYWQERTQEMQRLEEENNLIFIDAYGLQEELTPEVPLNEITLTCNPHYRYSNNKNTEELDALLLADTMKEYISYAVGCMFGRYALDKPGLILANQGDTIEEYLRQIPELIFPADHDNVLPILDGDWFTDDITERFRKFLRITFGEEHYEENLKFIEVALGKDIRKYFLKDFYNDHLRRYKKRPIYWLFSSPKGSFNALIYMHRYRPDTVSVVLNGYLREFRIKLLARKTHLEALSISGSASIGEKTKALKEIESLRKMIEELERYERDVLYPLATEQIAIDLDDGVKVNYQKFGPALKKIVGLDIKEE